MTGGLSNKTEESVGEKEIKEAIKYADTPLSCSLCRFMKEGMSAKYTCTHSVFCNFPVTETSSCDRFLRRVER